MKPLALLSSTALLLAGLAFAGVPTAHAQDQDARREQHHPAQAASQASEPAAPQAQPGPGGMMGMMSPEMMERMQEMMANGMPMEPGMMGGQGMMMRPTSAVTIIINTHEMPAMGGGMMGGQIGPGAMGQGMMGQGMMGGRGMMMGPQGMAARSPATMAYWQAMMRMHQGMSMALTGDPDGDFARLMIPHHQSAIDMAKVALQYGKDPEIRQLAQSVVDAQSKEIATLQDWLAKHPQR